MCGPGRVGTESVQLLRSGNPQPSTLWLSFDGDSRCGVSRIRGFCSELSGLRRALRFELLVVQGHFS